MSEPVRIHVLDKTVELFQPADGFWTSLDSVMMAAACPAEKGDRILDLGCGVGGAGFCVLKRVSDTQLTGVDIQSDHVDLATENAALNGMNARADFIVGDMREYKNDERFHHIICNPPYLEAGTYLKSPSEKKATALGHQDHDIDIADWIDAGFHNLKSRGSLTMIHRADTADKIIRAMGKRFGGVDIIPLWPKVGKDAKRVIIRAVKDSKAPARVHAGITLHKDDGEYTDQADQILRGQENID